MAPMFILIRVVFVVKRSGGLIWKWRKNGGKHWGNIDCSQPLREESLWPCPPQIPPWSSFFAKSKKILWYTCMVLNQLILFQVQIFMVIWTGQPQIWRFQWCLGVICYARIINKAQLLDNGHVLTVHWIVCNESMQLKQLDAQQRQPSSICENNIVQNIEVL